MSLSQAGSATASDYSSVTETWGLSATPEQLSMMYTRYRLGVELTGGGAVLEVGCGAGMGLPYLAERSRLTVGGDYTMNLLREAAVRVPEARLARLDAQALPFSDASFDAVLLLEMVYYVRDLPLALRETRRVLRPGGGVLISVPNPERPDFNPSPHAFEYPNALQLAELLRVAGFDAEIMGGFPIEGQSPRENRLAPLRHFAVRYGLIPRSMRLKSLVKRVLYGRLPRIGAVRDGWADFCEPMALAPSRPTGGYKTLYGAGRLVS